MDPEAITELIFETETLAAHKWNEKRWENKREDFAITSFYIVKVDIQYQHGHKNGTIMVKSAVRAG